MNGGFFKRLREALSSDQLIKAILKLRISAGEASSKAPLGPTLGQYGIQISEFCAQFNKLTEEYAQGVILITRVILFADLGYEIYILGVSIPILLKKILNISKFSPYGKKLLLPNSKVLMKVLTTPVLYELVNFKYGLGINPHISLKAYYKTVSATVRSVGLLLLSKNSSEYLSKLVDAHRILPPQDGA